MFGGLYFSTGMAVAQGGGYTQLACLLALGTVAVLMGLIGVAFGPFGGKTL